MGRNIEIQESFSYIQETFNLDGFGIYNIDRIMKMKEQQNVFDWVLATQRVVSAKEIHNTQVLFAPV